MVVGPPSPPLPRSAPGCPEPVRPSRFGASGRRKKIRWPRRKATPAFSSPASIRKKHPARPGPFGNTGRWKTATTINGTPVPGRRIATAIANPTPRSIWRSPATCSWPSFPSRKASHWPTSSNATTATRPRPFASCSMPVPCYEPASQTPCQVALHAKRMIDQARNLQKVGVFPNDQATEA